MSSELTLKVLAFWVVVQVLGNLATEGLKQPGTRKFLLEAFVTYRPTGRWRSCNDFTLIVFTIFTALAWIVVLVFGSILYGHPEILILASMVLALAASALCWRVASAEKSWTNGARYLSGILGGVLLYLSGEAFGRIDAGIRHLLAHMK